MGPHDSYPIKKPDIEHYKHQINETIMAPLARCFHKISRMESHLIKTYQRVESKATFFVLVGKSSNHPEFPTTFCIQRARYNKAAGVLLPDTLETWPEHMFKFATTAVVLAASANLDMYYPNKSALGEFLPPRY